MVNECKCIELVEYPVVFKNGITHIKVECVDCNRFIKWKPQNIETFKLWFGKYKGKELREVPTDYLKWYLQNGSDRKVHERINLYLGCY
jgi:hypothetical protein